MGKIAKAVLRGTSPYSQSRMHETPKLNKELPAAYEERTWRNKMHVNEDGYVQIPPMAWKNCVAEAAKFLSIQVEGKGKATYTKHFEAGILVTEYSPLDIKSDDVEGEWLFLPSDGVRGSGKRVKKCLPKIPTGWKTEAEFFIFDDTITESIFLTHLKQAGQLIGIGTFRPRNNGYWGRFIVESLEWKDYVI
jgi:hypothetical protein